MQVCQVVRSGHKHAVGSYACHKIELDPDKKKIELDSSMSCSGWFLIFSFENF